MSENWRLFIALELPGDVLEAISRFQSDLRKAIPPHAARWTRPEGIHLTLKFLGDTPAEHVPEIVEAVQRGAAGHRAFGLSVQGSGCFPNLERPRVLWLGVAGDLDALRALQADVERQLSPLGFPPEDRGFSPHLTLARVAPRVARTESAAIGLATKDHDPGELAAWRAASVSLMRSQLNPNGAIYTPAGEVPLAG